MQRFKAQFGALALAGAVAALMLGGGPALASSHPASSHPARSHRASHHAARFVTGPEVISGGVQGRAVRGNNTRIPLKLRGVVRTHGFIVVASTGKTRVVFTSAGKLTARKTGVQVSEALSRRTCRIMVTENETLAVLGNRSTGAFARASGPGAMQTHFAGFAPRYTSGPHRGQCNISDSGLSHARHAVATVLAAIVLTVR